MPQLPPPDFDIGLTPVHRGKVRDVYHVTLKDGRPAIMLVATDRLSAFDVVLPDQIPGRGIILTQITRFWLNHIEQHLPDAPAHHLISTDPADVAELSPDAVAQLQGRVTLGLPCQTIPIECVARGYLAGSGWKSYQQDRTVCGIKLPDGLQLGDRLPEPIFTPATKATEGHDENISFEQAADQIGTERADWLRTTTLRIYEMARNHAESRGLLLADTKLEFGLPLDDQSKPIETAQPILIDEVATPDSSRYWPAESHQPGTEPASFDKQIIRNALEALVSAGKWDKTPPGPNLPQDTLDRTTRQYAQAYEMITGAPAPI